MPPPVDPSVVHRFVSPCLSVLGFCPSVGPISVHTCPERPRFGLAVEPHVPEPIPSFAPEPNVHADEWNPD
jgi:hypothetical protein